MRERQMLKSAVAMAMMCGLASASLVGYHVEPVKASWSGHTDTIPPNNYVEQTVVACWDSLDRIELFAGAKGNGGAYRAGVWLDGAEVMWSWGDRVPEHGWVKFQAWDRQVAFTKGKQLTIRFTRGGNDSLEYYYRGDDPYKYGSIPNDIVPNGADLCARVYGRMNAVDSTDFGACEVTWWTSDASYHIDTSLFRARVSESRVRTVRLDLDWFSSQWWGRNSWNFEPLDSALRALKGAGCRVVGLLDVTPYWASTRVDSHPPLNSGIRKRGHFPYFLTP